MHAERVWEEPAGGGAVVARQLALLAGRCELFTALGDDALGRESAARLAELGIDVHVKWGGATRRAWTHVDAAGERTITVLGDKLLPVGPLPLDGYDLVFFVAGEPSALESARRGALRRRNRARAADACSTRTSSSTSSSRVRTTPASATTARSPSVMSRSRTARTAERSTAILTPPHLPTGSSTPTGPVTHSLPRCAFGLARGDDPHSAADLAAHAGAAVIGGAGPYEAQLAFRG